MRNIDILIVGDKAIIDGKSEPVFIGYTGEYGVTEVSFTGDLFDFERVEAVHKPYGGTEYIVLLEKTADAYKWVVSASDTTKAGSGILTLRMYADGQLQKSVGISTEVKKAHDGATGEPPAVMKDWISEATELLEEMKRGGASEETIRKMVEDYLNAHDVAGNKFGYVEVNGNSISFYSEKDGELLGVVDIPTDETLANTILNYVAEHYSVNTHNHDGRYLTEHQSLAEYAKKSEVPAPYDDTSIQGEVTQIKGNLSQLDSRVELLENSTPSGGGSGITEPSHNILKVASNRTSSGVTMTVNSDYTITLNGTSTSAGGAHGAIDGAVNNYYFPLEIGGVYTFLVEHLDGDSSNAPKFRYCTGTPDMNNGTLREISNGQTLYIDKVTYAMLCFGIKGDVYTNDKYRVCINKGTSHIPMDYNGTVSVDVLQNERIENLKSDKKDSILLIPHRNFIVDKLESDISSIQGVCEYTVDGVLYLAVGFKIDSTHSGIALVDSDGEVIKEVSGENYGHVNSITFCDKDNRIYIGASSSSNPSSLCYSLNATTLEDRLELNISSHSIWYYDESFYFVSGTNLRKWKYGEQATSFTDIAVLPSVGYTAQNICIANDVILYTWWDSANGLTRIYKYGLDGILLGSDSIYTNGEGEHGYVYGGKPYIAIDEKEVDGFTFTRKVKCYEYTGSIAKTGYAKDSDIPTDAHINDLIDAKLTPLESLADSILEVM